MFPKIDPLVKVMNVLGKKESVNGSTSMDLFDIKKIIVAVDLSPHSEKTATYAASFAKNVGASITLLHIFPPEPSEEFASEGVYQSFEQGRWLLAQKLVDLADQIRRTGVKCEYDFQVGDPAEEVARSAKDLQADLVITAAHHPGFLGRLLGMDQASRILHRAGCPVLIYHEGNE